jgi:hypothetical protein
LWGNSFESGREEDTGARDKWELIFNGVSIISGSFDEVIRTAKAKGDIVSLHVNNPEAVVYITDQHFSDARVQSITETVHKKQDEQAKKHMGYIDNHLYKFCWSCKQSKHIGEFGKRSRNKDGLASNCKQCVNKKTKLRRRNAKRRKYDKREY